MDTAQQLHLGIGRIFQGNQLGGKMQGYSTLQTHAFHFFTHDITSSTLARMFHELPAATEDITVLPGVLGCRSLRRTVQVRLGTNPAVRGTVARWHAPLHGLATAIHETSALVTSGS